VTRNLTTFVLTFALLRSCGAALLFILIALGVCP
jgi:hypothetical protein